MAEVSLEVFVSTSDILSKIRRNLAVIGKRAKKVNGESLYSDITSSTLEDPIFDDLLMFGAQNVVSNLVDVCTVYYEFDNTNNVDGSVRFTLSSPRIVSDDSISNILSGLLGDYIYHYCIGRYLETIHPGTGEKYPPLFAKSYLDACGVIMTNIKSIAFAKREVEGSGSWASVGMSSISSDEAGGDVVVVNTYNRTEINNLLAQKQDKLTDEQWNKLTEANVDAAAARASANDSAYQATLAKEEAEKSKTYAMESAIKSGESSNKAFAAQSYARLAETQALEAKQSAKYSADKAAEAKQSAAQSNANLVEIHNEIQSLDTSDAGAAIVAVDAKTVVNKQDIAANKELIEENSDAIRAIDDDMYAVGNVISILDYGTGELNLSNNTVGNTLYVNGNTNYNWVCASVNAGEHYYVDFNIRGEYNYWVYLTDENDTIISRAVYSDGTDSFGRVKRIFAVPSGATRAYAHSYTGEPILYHAERINSAASNLIEGSMSNYGKDEELVSFSNGTGEMRVNGNVISFEANSNYYWRKFGVVAGKTYIAQYNQRNTNNFWVLFADVNNKVVSKYKYSEYSSSLGDAGYTEIVNLAVTPPIGTAYVYVGSFMMDASMYSTVPLPEKVNSIDLTANQLFSEIYGKGFINSEGNITSGYVSAQSGDTVTWRSDYGDDVNTLFIYDANKNVIDAYCNGFPRTITIADKVEGSVTKVAAYIVVLFNNTRSNQYLYVNSQKICDIPYYNLCGDVDDLKSNTVIPGEPLDFDEEDASTSGSAYITIVNGKVSFTSRETYRWRRYAVVSGESYVVKIHMRNEPWTWVHFTDDNNNVVGTAAISNDKSDNSEQLKYVTASSGATRMYVQSFNKYNPFAYKPNNKIGQYVASLQSGESSGVPSFVTSKGNKTYKRLLAWAGGAKIFTIGFISDVHSGGSDTYKQVGYLNYLNSLFNFNCLVNCGDIGLDTADTNGDTDKQYDLMINTKKGMDCTSPWIFCKGNHERKNTGSVSTNAVLGQVFNKASQRSHGKMVFGDSDGMYGYMDFSDMKIRVFFLNTTDSDDGSHYIMSNAQLNWLKEKLLSTSDGWGVIVLSHLCVDDIGRWSSYPDDAKGSYFDTLRTMVKNFSNHTGDFSGKTSKLICSLAGDSHFNNYIKRDGVNYIVRQGYGDITVSDIPSGGARANLDRGSDCCFDVLAVKSDGNAKVFRIGAGDSNYDLSFTY